MAKKENKSAAQQAAAQAAPTGKQPVEVIQTGDLMSQLKQNGTTKSTLSPDATVMALNGLKTMVHDNPNAAEYYGMSEDSVKKINTFTLAGFATVLAIEVEQRKSPFAIKMLENQPEAINAISQFTGVQINVKALPAPDAKGEIEVPSTAIVVSEEGKKQIKKEKDIENTEPTTNPAEIENENQLAASLSNLLTKGADNIGARIKRVIDFYRGYLTIQANKAEDKEKELQKVKSMTRTEMFEKISVIVGECPFAMNGTAKIFRNMIQKELNPVVPFCIYRRTSANGDNSVDDEFVGDILKILVKWSCNSTIEHAQHNIAEAERLIKKNEKIVGEEKDATKKKLAQTAINNYVNAVIPDAEKCIAEMQSILVVLTNPSFDAIDSLIENYNGKDDTKDEYKVAHRIVDNVIKTYYKGVDMTKVDNKALLNNVQQRAGIIINIFRDPLTKNQNYDESNITELKEAETSAEGEEKAE